MLEKDLIHLISYRPYIQTTELLLDTLFTVPLELHPKGVIFFLAPAGGSNPAGP